MNKGRNLAILMACLLSLSLLAFLTRQTDAKRTAVVDRVRYIQEVTEEGELVQYSFYFVGDRVMEGHLNQQDDGTRVITIYERIPPKGEEYELEPYGYVYSIQGNSLKDGKVTWAYAEGFDETFEEEPFERFSQKMFLTMMFGRSPLVSIPQAVLVAIIAAAGALIIFYAEELWHIVRRKRPEEDPKWEEMTIYKRVGAGIMIGAAVLLLIFVLV